VPTLCSVAVDILFVIDNSGSMGAVQESLAASLPSLFIDRLSDSLAPTDFHIAVISTDMDDTAQSGRFQAAPGNPKILTPDTPNVKQVLSDNLKLGTHGSGFERPLAAMEVALSLPLIGNENAGFLRAKALLGIVVVSDEDDCSGPPGVDDFGDDSFCYSKIDQMTPVQHFVDFLKGLKGGDAGKIAYAYIGGPDIPIATRISGCSRDSECESGLCWQVTDMCCPSNPAPLACRSDSDCAGVAGTSCVGRTCMFNMTQRPYPPHQCSCFGRTFGTAAVPGTRNIDMVKAFGSNGIFSSICTDDWNKIMQDLFGGWSP
jgi:hypothetical protein